MMSENSKDLRELLIELEYGELDEIEAAEVQSRIDADPAMLQVQQAFRAVRRDLHTDEEIEVRPARIAFVAMPAQPQPNAWSPLWKGLAVAASFTFGIVLSLAFANLAGVMPLGETGSAGFGTQGADTAQGLPASRANTPSVDAIPVAQMSQQDLVNFLDSRYARRNMSGGSIADMDPEQLRPVLDQLISDREQQLRQVMQQMITVADERQRQEIETLMAGVYQTFDAQRTNDLLVFADQLGILQEATGVELQRNTDAIDYLFTRVGTNGQERQQ
jgi:hypothetical protein